VRVEGNLGESFDIITGVKQGYVLLPLILLMVMDLILKRATAVISTDLQWIMISHLWDLDFADDIALLTDS